MKNPLLSLISIFITILLLFCQSYAQSDFQLEIDRINYTYKQDSNIDGMITITYAPGSEGRYLSIGATDPSTGKFNIIVSNLFLPGTDEVSSVHSFSVVFNLGYFATTQKRRASIPSYLVCYIHLFNSIALYPFDPSTWVDTKEVEIKQTTEDAKGSEIPQDNSITITTASAPGYTVGDTRTNYRYRSDVPNLDLNDSLHGDSETYAGDLNACVPTATSNSVKWMAMKYNDIKLPDGMMHRDILEKLSGYMKRKRNEGTSDTNMVLGKLDFFEAYNLPVEVKYQAKFATGNIASSSGKSIARDFGPPDNKPPTWDFLKKQMKDGEDVEMNYTWYNAGDNKWYAHSVCITGINEFASGVKKIAFKHDLFQEKAGGLKEEVHEVTVDTSGWMRFGVHNEYYIKTIVAESPVIPFGREAAAWLNEIFADAGSRKKLPQAAASFNNFIEVALHQSVTDLNNYKISLYDGATGTVYSEYTLNQFTAGTSVDSLTTYYYSFQPNELHSSPAGVAISYTGSIIPGQFYSYGGSFTAVEGDATGLTSTDLGNTAAGQSFILTGTGTNYLQFSWQVSNTPTPGELNPGQVYSANPPAVPLLALPGNGSTDQPVNVTLKWNASPAAVLYSLEVARDSLFSAIIFRDSAISDTMQQLAALTNNTKYFWRVKAINGNGASDYSSAWSFTTSVLQISAPILAMPENNAAMQPFNIALKWNSVPLAANYYLQAASDSGFVSLYIDEAVADTFRQVGNLSEGTKYYWKVRSVADGGMSAYSSVWNFTTMLTAPDNLFAASQDNNKVKLTWADNSNNENGYQIERKLGDSASANTYSLIYSTGANATSYVDTAGLLGQSFYTYRIRAFNAVSYSHYSREITVDKPVPVELAAFSANVAGRKIILTWSTASESNNLGFEVERNKGDGWKSLTFIEGRINSVTNTGYKFIDDFQFSSYSGKVNYRLKQIDLNGGIKYSTQISVEADFTPKEFALYQNFPNPFNPSTTVRFALPVESKVKIEIFNLIGETINVPVKEVLAAGYHQYRWTPANLPSGVYLIRLSAVPVSGEKSSFSEVKKILFTK